MPSIAISLGFGLLVLVSGCSEKPQKPRTNPCELLSVGEMQSLDENITASEWFPPNKAEPSELCIYSNSSGERRVMLYSWNDASMDPLKTIESGISGSHARVVEVNGVGEKAAAGFRNDVLKLFAAKSANGMVGIRTRDPVKDGDEKFATVKTLAAKALTRLH
jgi:hypothetical protein